MFSDLIGDWKYSVLCRAEICSEHIGGFMYKYEKAIELKHCALYQRMVL